MIDLLWNSPTSEESMARHIDEARRRAGGRVSESAIDFSVANAQSLPVPLNSVDLAVCLGSAHAFGEGADAYRNALRGMIPLVKPKGLILIADGYMKQPAAEAYRRLLGDSIPDSMTHARNVEAGTENGLTPLAAWVASDDEWDAFEWGYQRIIERQAAERPDDPDIAAKLTHRRDWMTAYLRHGRDTLGYGTYLFKKNE